MKRLLKYLADYKKESVLAPLFKLLEALLDLLVPVVVAAIIDQGINGSGGTPAVVRYCLLLAGLAAVGLAASITAQYFAAKAATGFAKQVRGALFRKIDTFSYSDLDSLGAPTLLTRMTNDVNQLQNGVNMVLRLFLRSPFIVFGAMIMAFTIDVKSALVFAAVIPVLAAVIFAIILVTIPKYKQVQEGVDGVLAATRENLSGTRVIRAFRIEQTEIDGFDRKNRALTRLQLFAGRISALMNPVTYVIINAAIIALIYVGALRVDAGVLTQGAVIGLYNYMSQVLVELIKLANLIITMTKALASANRVADLLDRPSTETTLPENDVQTQAKVLFDHVTLTYRGAGEASLSDVCLSVPAGQTVGVIGGTGSGKTSLVNLIPRFYDVTKGCVKIGGTDVRKLDAETLRKNIGIVPQRAALFKGTIRSNLLWGKEDATDEELWEALKTAQAEKVALDKGGLDADVEQEGRNFSGGQRQRLTVARALVRKPKILILDDSASALDLKTDAALREAISKLCYKPTVFIVSQRAAAVMNAQLIVVLDEGAVVGMGTHDELMKSCPAYEEIYSSQFKKEADR